MPKPYQFAPALPDSPFVDSLPMREELRMIASRVLRVECELQVPQTRESIIDAIRHSDLPFAFEEYMREQLDRAAAAH